MPRNNPRPSEVVMMLMSLSDAALAQRLRWIGENVRWCSKAERRAYLIEAARRLEDARKPAPEAS